VALRLKCLVAAAACAFPLLAASGGGNTFDVTNRPPLVPSAFIKLPIGSITPRGWLRRQLELEANGMTGHLEEISKWCKFENSAWASRDGQGQFGWEELPYWLKGFGDLGYVLQDEKIIKAARKWIEAVLSSQEPDGYFGPRANKTGLEGRPDLWPHMVMLNVLQSFYEYTGDERVPLEQAMIYKSEPKFTDLTDQELFFEIDIVAELKRHNLERVKLRDKTVKEREEKLEPARVRDLKMTVVDIAAF